MSIHFDHLTIVVRDVERAKAFFAVLGFKEAMSVVIAGEPFASYMGVPGIEAEHVTLVLENFTPRTEFSSCTTAIPIRCPIRTSATSTRSA
jgi:catechol 2,3-dioxygenase-like lactoylglutathione lyase family enzyme